MKQNWVGKRKSPEGSSNLLLYSAGLFLLRIGFVPLFFFSLLKTKEKSFDVCGVDRKYFSTDWPGLTPTTRRTLSIFSTRIRMTNFPPFHHFFSFSFMVVNTQEMLSFDFSLLSFSFCLALAQISILRNEGEPPTSIINACIVHSIKRLEVAWGVPTLCRGQHFLVRKNQV